MQIFDSYSESTEQEQTASPDSSLGSYADLLEHHFRMVIDCLEIPSSSPASPAVPFDMVFVANIDRCQRYLTWDHLPDDVWTEDVENWLLNTVQPAVEVHPAGSRHSISVSRWSSSTESTTSFERMFPSFELPPLDLFTDIGWQVPIGQYSPSEYSQDDFGFSQVCSQPLGIAAHKLMQNVADAPINYISTQDLFEVSKAMRDVCTELRATVNRAEDSAEFDCESNSDVSSYDLNSSSVPVIDVYQIAQSRGLTTLHGSPPSSNGSSRQSYVRLRHGVQPDIHNRMVCLANNGLEIQVRHPWVYLSALSADGARHEN